MKFGKRQGYSDVWFSWHPVRLHSTGRWVWLEYVKRVRNFDCWSYCEHYREKISK